MRTFTLVLTGLLLCSLALAQAVLTSDFETAGPDGNPEGWRFAKARGECFGKWDDEHAASGERSLRMSIPRDAAARAHWRYGERIPLKPDTSYRLSMKIMAVNITGEAYAIGYENGQQTPDYWHDTARARGTHDWKQYALEFKSRPDAEWLLLICKLRHGTGYAWFDDVVLEEIDEAIEEKVDVRLFPEDDGFSLQAMWQPAQWTQHDVFHLMRGHMNPLALYFWGPDKAKISDPALIVEATEGLTLRGPVVRGRGPMPRDVQVSPTLVERDGKAYRQWRLPIPQDSLLIGFRNKAGWESYHHIYADVSPSCPANGEIRWRLETGGEQGPEHALPVRVGAATPGKLVPPEDFRIYVQHTGALRHPDPAVRERLVDYLNAAGIVGGFSMTFYEPDKVDVDKQYMALGLDLHTWRFDGYGGAAPDDHRLIDANGERSTSKVCPQSQIEKVEPWYSNLQSYYTQKLASGLKRLIIDYEPPTFGVCFCERCRKVFAERLSLPVDECLSLPPKELQAKYREQWGQFRAWQNGQIVKLHCAVIHEIDPEVNVGLCSWRGTEAAARSGADIRLFEPEAAFHAPMIYTLGLPYHDAIQETCARTTAPVLPFIELADISQPRSLTPDELRMNLLATGLSGGGGAYMWVGMECFDAQFLAKIRQAVGEIATMRQAAPWNRAPVEWLQAQTGARVIRSITVDGEELPVYSDYPEPFVRAHIWGTDDRALVALLNYDTEKFHTMRVKLTKDRKGTFEVSPLFPAGQAASTLSAAELTDGVTVQIPPEGLAAVAVNSAN